MRGGNALAVANAGSLGKHVPSTARSLDMIYIVKG